MMAQNMFKSAQRKSSSSLLRSSAIRLLIISTFTILIQPISSEFYHMAHEIPSGENQCIYSKFDHGEFATFEMYIADAPETGIPQAQVQIEGPICSPLVGKIDENGERTWPDNTDRRPKGRKMKTMGAEMQFSIGNWADFIKRNSEHFTDAGIIHHAYLIDWSYAGEEEDAIAARADLSRQRNEKKWSEEKKRSSGKTKEEGGEYNGDENIDEEEYAEENWSHAAEVIPEDFEPYEWTKPIKAAGWYRLCVKASSNTILVEMDIRSSAELGGIDRETGHVYRQEDYEEMMEEKRIMELEDKKPSAEEEEQKAVAAELERALKDQVRDFDLDSTKNLMSEVKRLVSDLQKKQLATHKRIKGHEGDARRNYRKIVRSGMMETGLYLAITLFQIYTVRKWLLSNTMLGR